MFNSIRIRLAFRFTAIMAIVLMAFAASAYWFVGHTVRRQTDETLTDISRSFVEMIETEQAEDTAASSAISKVHNAINEAAEGLQYHDYQIFVYDKQELIAVSEISADKQHISREMVRSILNVNDITEQKDQFFDLAENGTQYRSLVLLERLDDRQYAIVAVHPVSEEVALNRRFIAALLLSIPVALILSCLGGYFLAKKALSPVVTMSSTAASIGVSNLSERIPIENAKDELGKLAAVFNTMLDRLERSFDDQRRFVADASHELRTPVAIVRGESEVALSRQDRSLDEYRCSLEVVHDESRRLTRIVDDLFMLTRSDAGQLHARFAPVYLDEIASDVLRSMRVLADGREIELEFRTEGEMRMSGDVSLLHRMLLNLIDNAIKYSSSGGKVSVICREQGDEHLVQIVDKGQGISSEDRERIFERFYRSDKARSRQDGSATGGAGLGLPIAARIAEIHNGVIKVDSTLGKGTVVSVSFPHS